MSGRLVQALPVGSLTQVLLMKRIAEMIEGVTTDNAFKEACSEEEQKNRKVTRMTFYFVF